MAAVGGRHVMIGHGQHAADTPDLARTQLQTFKSLRTGDFMYQMAVDIKQYRAVLLLHNM